MVTKAQLESYIRSIPPLPETIQSCYNALLKGDLVAAGKHAAKDPAVCSYFQEAINKPFFGFQGSLGNINQIFGALGIIRTQQLLNAYTLTLITPSEWKVFGLDAQSFTNLQAECIARWNTLLESKKLENDHEMAVVAALLPATIIVCEQMFRGHAEDAALIQEVRALSYHALLRRLTGSGFYKVAALIGKKWNLSERSLKLILLAEGTHTHYKDATLLELARFLHLLFFYLLSRPSTIKAGLNGFCDFDPAFVEPVMEPFSTLIGIES